MFSPLSPYRDSRPRSDRPVQGQVEWTSRSKLVGYSMSRFMILVILGLVSFVCAAPLQPEPAPTPTTTPSLVAFTLKPSSSSSASSSLSSSSPSTATAKFAPTFFPRTNESKSKSESKTFTVRFKDTTSNDNQFIQQPIQQLLAHANIQVTRFIGTPNTEDEEDYNFDLVDSSGVAGYRYDATGLGGRLSVEREVKGKVELIEVFEFRENEITVNKLQAESASGKKAS